MPELLDFQDAFVAAIGGHRAALSPWLDEAEHPGLAVYRNTIARGCVDALADNFPTVQTMVGEDWFRAAAALFAREAPPASAALLDYGADFPAWLQRFPPAAELPYLAQTRLTLHPSVRFAAFDAGLPSLWRAARDGAEDLELSETPETLLLVRQGQTVASRVVGAAQTAFLRACREGVTAAEAAQAAATADPDTPFAPLFAALIADGVFVGSP